MKNQTENPVVEAVRQRAMRISKRYGHDPKRYLKHLQVEQKRNQARLVRQLTVVP
jgi:hypothetical protein